MHRIYISVPVVIMPRLFTHPGPLSAQLAQKDVMTRIKSNLMLLVLPLLLLSGASHAEPEIGGYGELHYNNVPSSGVNGDETVDFHRFVLFFGHEFSEDIHFFSEVELEHSIAGEGKGGEVELEQAFIHFRLNDSLSATAGLFLVPVGIVNENHEPPVFYGVERNPVEKRIIPATWWEAGAMMSGTLPEIGFSYDLAYHSGLDAGANIRSGRQKVSGAEVENKAMTGRVRYSGQPGLELAATVQYQEDLDQIEGGADDAVLIETHIVLNKGAYGARGLYAAWDINGDVGPKYLSQQTGYYLEGSYKVASAWGVFGRYSMLNYRRTDAGLELKEKQHTVGVNYWPHEDVVVKADIQMQNDDAGDGDGFNLGIGYQF